MQNNILTILLGQKSLVRLFFLLFLLHIASCDNKTTSQTPSTSQNQQGAGKPAALGSSVLTLTSPGSAQGHNDIQFQLTNTSAQAIELKKIKVYLTLTQEKYNPTGKHQPGILAVKVIDNHGNAIHVPGSHKFKKSANKMLGKDTLRPGESVPITVQITKGTGLVSAQVTCAIDYSDKKKGKVKLSESVLVTFNKFTGKQEAINMQVIISKNLLLYKKEDGKDYVKFTIGLRNLSAHEQIALNRILYTISIQSGTQETNDPNIDWENPSEILEKQDATAELGYNLGVDLQGMTEEEAKESLQKNPFTITVTVVSKDDVNHVLASRTQRVDQVTLVPSKEGN